LPFEEGWTELWNAAGSSTPITLNVNKDELSCTAPEMSQQIYGLRSSGTKQERSGHALTPKPCSEK
jgi:hypothetical protein